jgi:hypothetical protein
MIANVTFMNKHNEDQTLKVNMFGPNKNHVNVNNVFAIFKASIAIMFDGSLMEAYKLGLSMDFFVFRLKHVITSIPTLDPNNFLSKIFINLSFLLLVQKFVFEY